MRVSQMDLVLEIDCQRLSMMVDNVSRLAELNINA